MKEDVDDEVAWNTENRIVLSLDQIWHKYDLIKKNEMLSFAWGFG